MRQLAHFHLFPHNAHLQISDMVCYAHITNTQCNNECMALTPIPTFGVFMMEILVNTHKHSRHSSNRPNHHRTANTNDTKYVTETNGIFEAHFKTHFLAHTFVTHVSITRNKCSVLSIISTLAMCASLSWDMQPCIHCWLHKAFCPQCTYGNWCAMLSTVWQGGAEATVSKPGHKVIVLAQNKLSQVSTKTNSLPTTNVNWNDCGILPTTNVNQHDCGIKENKAHLLHASAFWGAKEQCTMRLRAKYTTVLALAIDAGVLKFCRRGSTNISGVSPKWKNGLLNLDSACNSRTNSSLQS